MAEAEQPASTSSLEGPLLALGTAGLYYIVFRLNELLDPWTLYAQGISLVFLPAGVKHVAILVARGWGALGCFAVLFLLAHEFWAGASSLQILVYSAASTLATWTGLALSMRLLRIDRELSNLRFMHLPLMDLITTGVHGLVVNAYFIAAGMKAERFFENALAMMVGDFIGSFLMLMGFWAVLEMIKAYKERHDWDGLRGELQGLAWARLDTSNGLHKPSLIRTGGPQCRPAPGSAVALTWPCHRHALTWVKCASSPLTEHDLGRCVGRCAALPEPWLCGGGTWTCSG